eukprot:10288768-Alexandrium_andersonii.AAC.1
MREGRSPPWRRLPTAMPCSAGSLQPVEAAGAHEAHGGACRGVPFSGRPSAALACLAGRPQLP